MITELFLILFFFIYVTRLLNDRPRTLLGSLLLLSPLPLSLLRHSSASSPPSPVAATAAAPYNPLRPVIR